MLSVAVLEAEGGELADLLAAQPDIEAARATSLDMLMDMVAGGGIDAVLADPDLPESWPTSAATELTEGLASSLPVVLVCRSTHDVDAVRSAVAGTATVLLRDALDGEGLLAILKGEVAKHQAVRGASGGF